MQNDYVKSWVMEMYVWRCFMSA